VVTVGQKLDECRGFGPGFDFLRVFFASAIVAWHCVTVAGGLEDALNSPFWFAGYSLVPMFFILSGFLVTGSALRLSLKNFFINRSLRIVPALAVDIVISAIIIALALSDYFTSTGFFTYFFNILGFAQLHLPGVFETHPADYVNVSLWTIPYEIGCYILMGWLIWSQWLRKPTHTIAFAVILFGLACLAKLLDAEQHLPFVAAAVVDFLFLNRGGVLLPAFLFGVAAYQLRYRIP